MEAVVMIAIQLTSLFLQVVFALLRLTGSIIKMIFGLFVSRGNSDKNVNESGTSS